MNLKLHKTKSFKKSKYIDYLVLPLFSFFFVLLCFELFLRIFLPQYKADLDHPPMFLPDDNLGHRLRSNYISKNITQNLNYSVSIDSYGNRRSLYDHNSDYPNIFGIGDSYTFGHGVNANETYLEKLRLFLHEKGYNYNIFNLGVCGYGTHNATMKLKSFLDQSQDITPDIILLGLYLGNDFDDNSRPIHSNKYFRYVTLLTKMIFMDFHSYRFLRNILLRKFAPKIAMQSRSIDNNKNSDKNNHIKKEIILNNDNNSLKGERETKHYLLELNEIISKINAKLIVLIIPDPFDKKTSELKQKYINNICKEEGLMSIDLHKEMFSILGYDKNDKEDNISFREDFHNIDRHWNTKGNNIVAKIVSSILSDEAKLKTVIR